MISLHGGTKAGGKKVSGMEEWERKEEDIPERRLRALKGSRFGSRPFVISIQLRKKR